MALAVLDTVLGTRIAVKRHSCPQKLELIILVAVGGWRLDGDTE